MVWIYGRQLKTGPTHRNPRNEMCPRPPVTLCGVANTGMPDFANVEQGRIGIILQVESVSQAPNGVLLDHQSLEHAINQKIGCTGVIGRRRLVVGPERHIRVSDYIKRATNLIPSLGISQQFILLWRPIDKVTNSLLKFGDRRLRHAATPNLSRCDVAVGSQGEQPLHLPPPNLSP